MRKRPIIVASALLATAAVGLTAAQFISSSDSEQQSIGTGVVGLQMDGVSPLEWTSPIANLAAGDEVSRYVDLRNSGTLGLQGITAAQSSTLDLSAPVFISLNVCSVAWNTQSGTCGGKQSVVLVDTALQDWTQAISLDTFSDFEAGQVRHLQVSTRLDTSAVNTDQGRSGQISYTFTGTQRQGNAATSIASQGTRFGVFAAPVDGQSDLAAVQDFESITGRQAPVVSSFWSWGYSQFETSAPRLREVLNSGRTPMVTWEPWTPESDTDDFPLDRIVAGDFDDYITSWATGLRDLDGEVYLRFMHEGNGNWYPWGGSDPVTYKAAWVHVHDIFASVGADNVKFVYSPNNQSVGTTNTITDYYPGDAYVDVLALDGYNCLGGAWRSFGDLFSAAYAEIAALNSKAPIWIGETATCESADGIAGAGGHTKAEWVSDMMNASGFDRLELIVWFNDDKEFDWRINSSPESLSAYRD